MINRKNENGWIDYKENAGMEQRTITKKRLHAFAQYLAEEEHSRATVEKYLREVMQLSDFLQGAPVEKSRIAAWKAALLQQNYHPSTVNGKLTAVDCFLRFWGWQDCQVKHLKVQRKAFRDSSRDLTKEEYRRLLQTAEGLGRERLLLLIETICATGIRVSEVRYITYKAIQTGKAEIFLKGKVRTILIPGRLCRKLQKYANRQKITSGELFLTRSGKGLSRKQIWVEMKRLCEQAEVEPTKVFPHNLRHLFARCFYRACRDVAKLADVLGHSSIETTRIYLISTGTEHVQALNRLRLLL